MTVAALCGAAACVSLAGLTGGEPLPDGDGGDAAQVDATPPDPCNHHVPPPPPVGADDPGADIDPLLVAIVAVSVRDTLDGGELPGYDLDGVCTCFPDPRTAHDGGSACVRPDGGVASCDADGGADVQLERLLAPYPGYLTAGSDGFSGATLLLKVTQYNGRATDPSVFVALIPSAGIYDITDCGPDAGVDAGEPPYDPTGRACDTWTLDPANLLPGTNEPSTFQPAYVTDNVLVLPATANPITITIAGAPLRFQSTELTARLVAVDDKLVPLSPAPDVGALFRLEDGMLAGRVATADALRAIALSEALTGKGPLCQSDPLFSVIRDNFICPGADVVASMAHDFTNAPCDALSVAAAFKAQPGRAGEPRSGDPVGCKPVDDPSVVQVFQCGVSP